MGLFDNDDTSKMEEKDATIADLRRELLAAKSRSAKVEKEAKVVLRNEGSEDEDEVLSSGVRAVTIKLPPFSESNPELWFSKAESQFVVKGITSDTTKFHHLYALMTDKAANEIEALLLNPPKTGKVDAMRTKLVRRFGRSQYDKDIELLNTRSLGDLTPSQMWARFRRLNKDPGNATSSFIKAYLISMYPPEVRGALANMDFADNDEMAEAADRYMEKARKRPGEINAVQEEESPGQVDAISHGRGRGQAARGRGGPVGHKATSPSGASSSSKTCFFHDRHGLGAFKCGGPPCPFASAPLASKPAGNATAGR